MRIGRYLLMAIAATVFVAAGFGEGLAQTVQLNGTVPSEALKLPNFGDLPAQQTLPLQIWFKPRNQARLNKLLADQQDPKSAQYHKWLTPSEYTQRFGVTQAQYDKIARWLGNEGFQVTAGSPADGYIKFSGSALSIGHAFGTRIAKFSRDGSKYANVSEPQIPAEYDALVGSVTGLDNLHATKAMSSGHLGHPATPKILTPGIGSLKSPLNRDPVEIALAVQDPEIKISGSGPHLGPSDFYAFYDETPLNNAGVNGTGCIAIIGDSDFSTAPIQSFNNQFNLPDNSGTIKNNVVLADGSNPGISGDEGETLLDLEWSHAVAPNATIKYFLGDDAKATANGSIIDAFSAAVNDGTCAVISISFGLCGGSSGFFISTIGSIVNKAQSQGQTILVSAGDDGAAGITFNGTQCVTANSAHVNELASNPLITSVGGTSFSSSAFNASGNITAHIAERVWDDPNDGISNGGATGGGASTVFSKPSFQTGVTPNDGSRDQPDVALLASPNFPGSFFYNENDQLDVIGGTSISAPMWAGIIDLLVQKTGKNVGSINQNVYTMAAAGQSAAGFFDVTSGNNDFNGVTGFSAVTGYDQSTGWGTVDINNFVTAYVAKSGVGGTPTPTATPTATATSSPSPTTTPTPTATPTPKVPASLSISPGSVNFGKTKVGTAKQKIVTFTNTSPKKGGTTITFQNTLATIPAGTEFFFNGTSCTTKLAPKQKCKVIVGFAPTGPGSASVTATVFDNASNSNQMFGMSGNGTCPKKGCP